MHSQTTLELLKYVFKHIFFNAGTGKFRRPDRRQSETCSTA